MNGLSKIPTAELKALEQAIVTKRMRFPVTVARFRAAGLAKLAPLATELHAFDETTLAILISYVLKERQANGGPELELVWTGPDVPHGTVRETSVVVRDLFSKANESVIVGGCFFSQGQDILRPLYKAMTERSVDAILCIDIPDRAPPGQSPDVFARQQVRAFITNNWPFGEPVPKFYYDPRTVMPNSKVLLHSKCIVVDDRIAFITSANFTHNGQWKNIETGVVIHGEQFAGALSKQWRVLIDRGRLKPVAIDASDVGATQLDLALAEWEELRELIDEGDLSLFDRLKVSGLPAPDDCGVELTLDGRVTGETSLVTWERDERDVALVRPGTSADDVLLVEVLPSEPVASLVERLKAALGVKT